MFDVENETNIAPVDALEEMAPPEEELGELSECVSVDMEYY